MSLRSSDIAITTALRAAVSGAAAAIAIAPERQCAPVIDLARLSLGWTETATGMLTACVSIVLITSAIAVWFRRGAWTVLPVAIWIVVIAVARMWQSASHAWLVPGAHATRYLCPVALLLFFRRRDQSAFTLLRLATAATFACHGIEALLFEPEFIELVRIASRDVLGSEFEQPNIEKILRAIGIADLVVAVGILWKRSTAIAAYMTAWGLLTATSRIVHSGLGDAWDGTMIRLPNACAPLAILLLLRRANRSAARHIQ